MPRTLGESINCINFNLLMGAWTGAHFFGGKSVSKSKVLYGLSEDRNNEWLLRQEPQRNRPPS